MWIWIHIQSILLLPLCPHGTSYIHLQEGTSPSIFTVGCTIGKHSAQKFLFSSFFISGSTFIYFQLDSLFLLLLHFVQLSFVLRQCRRGEHSWTYYVRQAISALPSFSSCTFHENTFNLIASLMYDMNLYCLKLDNMVCMFQWHSERKSDRYGKIQICHFNLA